MLLIVILLAALLERMLASLPAWRNTRWFMPWVTLNNKVFTRLRLSTGWLRVLLLLAPAGILFFWLRLHAGRLAPLLDLLVLVLTLGPRDLGEQVHRYLAAEKSGNRKEAAEAAFELTGAVVPDAHQDRQKVMLDAVFIRACERVVALLFWYVVAGPAGAVVFRLCCAATASSYAPTAASARRLRGWLSWVPVHIMAAAYLFSGHFDRAASAWREHARKNWRQTLALKLDDANHQLLAEVGSAAMQSESASTTEAIVRATDLVGRADLVVLALLAAATLVGWVL